TSSEVAARAVSPARRFLPGFEKLFRPAIIQILDNPLAATQFGDAVLAAQTGQHDADLLLRRKLPPRRAPDLLHNLLCRFLNRPGFLPHLRSFNGYDGPEILVTCRPAGLILVTARWQ